MVEEIKMVYLHQGKFNFEDIIKDLVRKEELLYS